MEANWAGFLARREARLAQQQRYGQAAEMVAEGILTDLSTNVLDWPLEGNDRGAHADMPEAAIPGALRTLEEAARSCGLMADQRSASATAYRQLAPELAQLRRGDRNGHSL